MSGSRICMIAIVSTVIVAAFTVGAPGALAAEPPGTIGLDSLLAIAMRDNERIVALDSAWRAAKEKIPQAGALPDPTFSYTAEGMPLKNPDPTLAEITRLELSQMFPFPGKQGAMKSAMAAEAEMALAERDRARLEVAAELWKSYYDLYSLYESIDLIEQNVTSLRDAAAIARTQYEVGKGLQQDLLKANSEVAVETAQLAMSTAMLPAAIARVNAILNRPLDQELGRPVLADTSGTYLTAMSLASLENDALEHQPELQMKDRAIARAQSNLRLARKQGLPDFMLAWQYMGMREMDDEWMGMIGVTLPIWRCNKVDPARREAEAALASARSDRNQSQNDVLASVHDARARAIGARTLVTQYRDSVLPQFDMSSAATRIAYETGRVDFLNLLDTQRSLLQSRMEFLAALSDYMKARADFGMAVGDPSLLGIGYAADTSR